MFSEGNPWLISLRIACIFPPAPQWFIITLWLCSLLFPLPQIKPYPVTEVSLLHLSSGTMVLNVPLPGALGMVFQSSSVLKMPLSVVTSANSISIFLHALPLIRTHNSYNPSISMQPDLFSTIKLLAQHIFFSFA